MDNKPSKTRLTITVDEAADLLGISRNTAYECVRTGEIPSFKLGRRILISRQALEQLVNHPTTEAS